MKDAKDLTEQEWSNVIAMWDMASDSLDVVLEEYRDHREVDSCAHPACTGTWLAEFLQEADVVTLAMLLHVALNRIETARLEKEAGL